ncbi:MAG: hypothetical protein ACXQTB_01220 [Candidatus Nezhaarchaeales archaeon]
MMIGNSGRVLTSLSLVKTLGIEFWHMSSRSMVEKELLKRPGLVG